MESQEVIDAFRNQLDQVTAQGVDQVQVSALRNYLNALERDAGASQEYRRQEHEGMLAHYSAQSQHSIEMLKAVLEAGKSALHALLIINGGAVIALLGVLGGLAGKDSGAKFASMLALPLLLFGVGVLAGAVGFSFRYFSQACYSESEKDDDKYQKRGHAFRYATIASVVVGFGVFGYAMYGAYNAVTYGFMP
ncbi:hypothetical protein [Marinobacterium sedimentorum]|uniref:hypothetical protein n=1 Tax=Marinobacterium sedimentorum TaxID=2927804 RepID=UPI0020C730EF|nr:hypothetical protein [Marinobacterium sedimentorum]MCP8687125.1 hypothetical protein [Marinobacterium sedimentorum]